MKILVTGGAGMVGSHTAEYFAKAGHQVIVLDNLARSHLFGYPRETVEYNWRYLGQYRRVRRIKGDVRNEQDVLSAIGSGVDVVIHTAGQSGVGLSMRVPKEDFSINAFGTLNVLECLRQKSPRAAFLYCSTNKIYGENVDQIPLKKERTRYRYLGVSGVDETMEIDGAGHTPYGASKYVGDLYTQEYAYLYRMRTAVFRMSCIYGTRQFGFEDQGWIAWFVIANLTHQPVTIYGDGRQVRDVLFVTDLVRAYERFLQSDLRQGIFNVGGGPKFTMSLLECLRCIEGRTGIKTKVRFSDWRPSDQKVYISKITHAKETLKWQPQVSPEEGVKRLIEWVKEHRKLFGVRPQDGR